MSEIDHWLEKFIVDPEKTLHKANPMEKKKLRDLDRRSEESYEKYNENQDKVSTIRRELPNPEKEKKAEFVRERDLKLLDNSREMREIKKRRLEIHQEFKIKTRSIKDLRKEVLDNSKELKNAKQECVTSENTWQKVREEFEKYYRNLLNKYQRRNKIEKGSAE